MLNYRNNLSGRNAAGYRFRFHNRSISHRALFLPLEMKQDPAVTRILSGENPCEVFTTSSIREARTAFNNLRLRFDFPFWAATKFRVRDINDADEIVTLNLNHPQHQIADIFLKRYFNKEIARYIITKRSPRCGLTTCVQAYIIWRQLYGCPKHENICGASKLNVAQLKANIARFFNKDIFPFSKRKFNIVANHCYALFNTFRTPDALRGIDFGYVHLVDMSKWWDPDGNNTLRAIVSGISGVLLDYRTLIVMEGNHPNQKKNPAFLAEIQYADRRGETALFRHIDLNEYPILCDKGP